MKRKLIGIEGTWAPYPWGLLGDVVNKVNKNWEIVSIDYPKRYGDPISYNRSVSEARNKGREAIKECQRKGQEYSIMGYSQGAQAAGDLAKEFGQDPLFLRGYLVADPSRSRRDRLIGPAVSGWGITGERETNWKVNQFAAQGDFICTNSNAFISNIAKYTYDMSAADPVAWVKSFRAAATTRLPGGDPVAGFRAISYYLTSQVHTKYATYIVEPGLSATQWIAKDLNRWK